MNQAPMLSPSERAFSVEEKVELVRWLVEVIFELCNLHNLEPKISIKTCEEVISRYEHDVDRLREGKTEGRVHPAKYVGYLCFWIRKLKPISQAFDIDLVKESQSTGRRISHTKEVIDVNEKISVSLFMLLLLQYDEESEIPELSEKKNRGNCLLDAMDYVYGLKSDVGPAVGTILQSIIYDMRYRTYGPHHLVHLGYNIISIAAMKYEQLDKR